MGFREFKIILLSFVLPIFAFAETIDELEKELRSSSMLTRHTAAEKLAQIGGVRAQEIFNRFVRRDSVEWKRIGLAGLASVAPKQSAPIFLEYLNDGSMMLRWAAVMGLGQTGDVAWIPQLKKMAQSDPGFLDSQKRYPVREAAEDAVDRLESSPHWLSSWPQAQRLAQKEKKPIVLFWHLPGEKWSSKMWDKNFTGQGFKRLKNRFIWLELNAVSQIGLADQFQIDAVPTLILIGEDLSEQERWTGYYSAEAFSKSLNAILKGAPTTQMLQKKLLTDPKNEGLLWALASRYEKSHRLHLAAPLWEKIVSLSATTDTMKRSQALFALGHYRGSVGQYPQAIPLLKQFLEECPQSDAVFEARYCLALCYLGEGGERKALKELQDLKGEPSLPEPLRQSVEQVLRKIKESPRS